MIERSKLRVANFYADLNARLAEAPFVAGDQFTVADITALVTVDFAARAISLPVPDGDAATRRWYAAVSARPSAVA